MKRNLLAFALSFVCSICVMAQTIEVKYFHGKQRCITCRNIEKHALELLQEDYAKEMKDGKIKFTVTDFSTDEGKTVAKDYKVTFSSLFVVRGKTRVNLTQMGFKYAKNQPEEFKKQLKKEIEDLLR